MTKKRWLTVLLTVLFLASAAFAMADVPSKWMDAFYVNDFASVISTADQETMRTLGEKLDSETGAQLVLVTTTFLDGMTPEDYGYEVYTNWGLGQTDDQNGVLITLAVAERKIWITTGEDIEGKLPASITNEFIDDYAAPHLKQGSEDYSLAMRSLYEALANKIASIYGTSISANAASPIVADDGSSFGYDSPQYQDNYRQQETSSGSGLGGIMGIIIGIIVIIVIFSIVRSLLRSAGNASGCLTGWLIGRSTSRPRRSFWGGGWGAPRSGPRGPMAPPPPRNRPSGGRSTGSFGGFGGFGGGSGRSSGGSSRPSGGSGRTTGRPGGGGKTRGGGGGRSF